MNPYDIRQALLAKHAQHVVIIHFPIALFIAGVVFDFAAQFLTKTGLRTAAYYNLLAAAISVPFAVGTGLLAWQFQLDGQKLHGIILLHLLFGTASAALIVFTWWMHRCASKSNRPLPSYRLPIEACAVGMVAFTGHLGGFLSGVNAPF